MLREANSEAVAMTDLIEKEISWEVQMFEEKYIENIKNEKTYESMSRKPRLPTILIYG